MDTKTAIRDFITNEMLRHSLETPLGDDDQLVESGIIDSLGVMTLLTFLEERYALQISGEDLIPDNFSSITTIASLVEQRRNN